jgi:hypothetical protein
VQPEPVFEARGILTLGDLVRFQYFHILRRTWWIAAAVVVLLTGTMTFYIITGLGAADWGVMLRTVSPYVLLLVLWVLLVGVMPYWKARRQFQSQSYFGNPITYTFTPETIGGQVTGGSWQVAWKMVHQLRETRSLFLLYQASSIAVLVPKRFFRSQSEMNQWRQLTRMCLASEQIEAPGVIARWC